MKKLIVLGLLLFTGCSSANHNMVVCNRTTNKMGVAMDLSYYVKYEDDNVTEIQSVEKIRSGDQSKLNYFKNSFEDLFKNYEGLDYYTYDLTLENNTLTSTVSIVYNIDNTDTLLRVAQSSKSFSKIGKVNVDSLLSYYKSVGISCEKK